MVEGPRCVVGRCLASFWRSGKSPKVREKFVDPPWRRGSSCRGNVEEVGSDGDNDDDMLDDSSEEDSDEEDSDNDDDDDDDSSNSDVIDDAIVEKFIRSFSNSDYDIEFDNALTLDRNVVQPAQITQALYIKPDNWVVRNRLGFLISTFSM